MNDNPEPGDNVVAFMPRPTEPVRLDLGLTPADWEEPDFELAICPFCRGRHLYISISGPIPQRTLSDHAAGEMTEYTVDCTGCGSRGPYARTAREAAEMWNDRELPWKKGPAA